jgi:hypothetical protein
MKCHGNPSSGEPSCCMLNDRTDVGKMIVAFRDSANAPEKRNHVHLLLRCELIVFLVTWRW